MKKCFECETTEDLHEHHVVPKSKGGTKTITLCHQCHMKAHGRDGKGMNHGVLTKEGMKKAKERGIKFGNPRWEKALEKASEVSVKQANERAIQHKALVISLYQEFGSYNRVAIELNKMDVRTSRGNKWSRQTIKELLIRIRKLGDLK